MYSPNAPSIFEYGSLAILGMASSSSTSGDLSSFILKSLDFEFGLDFLGIGGGGLDVLTSTGMGGGDGLRM